MLIKKKVENFKNLILDMYKGFPNYIYSDIENIIISESIRKTLIENGYLIEESDRDEKGKHHTGYMLGPSMLPLISSWKNEELAKQIKNLTVALVVLTVFLVILTIL